MKPRSVKKSGSPTSSSLKTTKSKKTISKRKTVELTSSLDSGLHDLLPLLSSQKKNKKDSSKIDAAALVELKRQEIQKKILMEKQTQLDLDSALDSLSNL